MKMKSRLSFATQAMAEYFLIKSSYGRNRGTSPVPVGARGRRRPAVRIILRQPLRRADPVNDLMQYFQGTRRQAGGSQRNPGHAGILDCRQVGELLVSAAGHAGIVKVVD